MAKILKLNAISPLADQIFTNYEYSDTAENPQGIMVRSAAMADYPVGDELLAVARAGAGTNNIPVANYAEKGIVVFNTPGANANAVKELVIAELFLGGRKIIDGIDWVKTLKNEGEAVPKLVEKGKGKFVGCEIAGKTLGVIGLGAIGAAVANAASKLGMTVVGTDPFLSVNNALTLSPEIKVVASREEVYQVADFITLHVPLNADTKDMIDTKAVSSMKDGAVIINNARGELVNTQAIIEALDNGKIARYVTDFPNATLIGVNNAVCVPHLGASTPEAEDNCAIMAARQLVDYLENGNITNSVNYPSLSLPREAHCQRVCVLSKNNDDTVANVAAVLGKNGLTVKSIAAKSKKEYSYCIADVSGYINKEITLQLKELNGILRVRTV